MKASTNDSRQDLERSRIENRQEAYIFGSGPSLLNLTSAEVEYLNSQSKTLSLNLYLHHWEKVGVVTKSHMLADIQFPNIKFFVEICRKMRETGTPFTFYINGYYLRYFPRHFSLRLWKHCLRKRWQVWRDHKYIVPLGINRTNLVTFSQAKSQQAIAKADGPDWCWANSIDEPLYFSRGTLSSAINLASILWPQADIKLLGVDLNSYGYFFDQQREGADLNLSHDELVKRVGIQSAKHHEKCRQEGTHATAAEYDVDGEKKLPGIQTAILRIRSELQRTGRDIYCCNPDSLLVHQRICEYRPVIPCGS